MKHTLEQLSAMPDRELDAVVAEVVMGWKWHLCHEANNEGEAVYHFRKDAPPEWWRQPTEVQRPQLPEVRGVRRFVLLGVPFYSSDWSAMGEVVEKIRPRAAQIDIWARRDGTYACYIHAVDEEFWKEGDFTDDEFAEAKDAPRAASIAAVLAVEASRD